MRDLQSAKANQASRFENGLTFHHVGYAVQSIETARAGFAASLAMIWDGQIFHDPLQQVRVTFFHSPHSGNPMIELVEPTGAESPVYRFVQRGGGLHHLCYEVSSLEKQLAWTQSNRDIIVRAPLPAVAFGGRRIAWVYTRTKMLLEYLERAQTAP